MQAGTVLNSDVCIVGAGPAGLTVASRLVDAGLNVVVLEAGGRHEIDWLDALDLDPTGTELEPLADSRWRQVGGTSVVWNARLRNKPAGRYLRLEADDFIAREWLPHSGWPFGLEELVPYYDQVERAVLDAQYTADGRATGESWRLDPEVLATTRERFGYASYFTDGLARRLAADAHGRMLTNSAVVGLTTDTARRRVEGVRVVAGSTSFEVRAPRVVLAAGGIENARLLLLAPDDGPRLTAADLVGRYYMDHPRVQLGHLVPADPSIFDHSSAYDIRVWDGTFVGAKIALTAAYRREHALLNGAAHVIPHPSARDAASLEALKSFLRDARRGRLGRDSARQLGTTLRGGRYLIGTGARLAVTQRTVMPVVADGGWSRLRRNHRRFESFEVVYQSEQAPDPDNRVTLGNEVDRFGLRRASVSSGWTTPDLDTIERFTVILDEELRRAGIGPLQRSVPAGANPRLYQVGGAHHPMGTTRMHADEARGVVDPDGRVHGVDNLYVAGSSVFSTGGYANPTLTLLALALRLGDHLRRQPR